MNFENRRSVMKRLGGAVAGSLVPALTTAAGAPPRIKIGQIGVGHAHASKLAVFRESAEYEVVGIAEPDAKLRERAQAQAVYRGLKWMSREQLLSTPGLDAVLVETRPRDLLDAAEACVAAGKHVQIDKPAGESLPQFRRILDAAAKQKLHVQMGYMFRYNPAVVLLRELLKRGWLGEVFEVHTVMSKVVDPAGRKAQAEYRGGTMFELGCHVIDLVVGVLGKPSKVTPFPRHSSSNQDTLLDNMLAVLEYPKALATVKSSALEIEGGERRHLVVCGTEGTFHIQPLDDPSARLALATSRPGYRKGYQDLKFPKYVRYRDDAADFARVIRREKAADFTYDHDLAVQDTVLRASAMPLDT